MKSRFSPQTLLAFIVSLFLGFLNISYVLIPFFKKPASTIYMAIGHYAYDYLNYLAEINYGQQGHWSWVNQFTSEDQLGNWVVIWPYLLAGQISRLFHILPPLTYWMMVFLLTVAILLAAYFLIRASLGEKKALVWPIFLTFIFAAPFFKIESISPLKIEAYRLTWYSSAIFFERLGPIPHHLLAIFFTLLLFIFSAHFWAYISKGKGNRFTLGEFFCHFLPILVLFILIMSLIPIRVVYLFPAFCLTSLYLVFWPPTLSRRSLLVLTTLVLSVIVMGLFGLYFKDNVSRTYFPEVSLWEKSQMVFPSLVQFLRGTGPIFILALFSLPIFGLRRKRLPPTILFGLVATTLSYGLFYTPISLFFNNHNSRFIFPEAYLFMGFIVFLTLDKVRKIDKVKTIWLIVFFLFVFSLPSLSKSLAEKFRETKSVSPSYQYLDADLATGFRFLSQHPGTPKVVLTVPQSDFSSILPAFADVRVFTARWLATINYHQKAVLVNDFYENKMTTEEKRDFLYQNGVRYIVWTIYDAQQNNLNWDDIPPWDKDLGLSLLFANSKIKIFGVN